MSKHVKNIDIEYDKNELSHLLLQKIKYLRLSHFVNKHSVDVGSSLSQSIFVSGDEVVENINLDQLKSKLEKCQACDLHSTRNQLVFGSGNTNADFMVIGEAPGKDEDLLGEPFVGRSGKLLFKIIEAIGLNREDIYIANIVKCRPPENRNPKSEEIEQCEPFLKQQIDMVQPKVICCVGKFASQTLLKTDTAISELRGVFASYNGIALMPTYHPAYLLRSPSAKKLVWEDMQQVHAKLCELTGLKLELKK